MKYAKPAGVIASLIPVTSPYVTPISIAIYAIKCKDAVIFSPHPSSRKTTIETVRLMRAALKKQGAPEDLLQCVERPSIPLANELMAHLRPDDRHGRTGDGEEPPTAPGKPAYGVGAGNATMVIDETANIEEAARNTRISKTNDHGSGLLGRRQPARRRCDLRRLPGAAAGRGRLSRNEVERGQLQAAYWDAEGRRTADTIARPAATIAAKAGFAIPADKTFFIVPERHIGKAHPFSTEKLGVVLSIFKYHGFDMALDMVRQIFETGGKGHSCGIYSFDDEHIHRLALVAPVSRIMVRQVQSSSNAGTFTNGMPMTSSMGCGVWGGNITNENISLKHYMNVTWVSRPIAEDRPSEQELFGEFYNTKIF